MPSQPPVRANSGDRIAGLVLLLFSVAWTGAVYLTVPAGYGIGPRAFPLYLGIALAALSAVLLIRSWHSGRRSDAEDGAEAVQAPSGGGMRVALRLGMLLAVAGVLAAYGYLMPRIGFVPATALAIGFMLVAVLRERRPVLVLAMSIGLSFGCWLLFGQVLGAYMPRGTWIPPIF